MRCICLPLFVCFSSCVEVSDVEFIGYPQVPDFADFTFLIGKVHENSWSIEYYFGERCGLRPKRERLESYVTHMLNVWLEPLKESSLVKEEIVSDFHFENIQRPTELYFSEASEDVDLFIDFECDPNLSRSYVRIGTHSPIMVMNKNSNSNDVTGYSLYAFLHELGHTLGLMDTYAFYNSSIKGESYDYYSVGYNVTLGNQPKSVMSGTVYKKEGVGSEATIEDYILVGDDKKGIIWLYLNYFYPEKTASNECYFPTFELELLHKDGDRGCVPINHLLFMIKNGYPIDTIRVTINRQETIQQLVNEREELGDRLAFYHYVASIPDDGGIELITSCCGLRYADINITDAKGRTPLHYAIKAGNHKIVEHLVRKNSWESTPIDLSLRLPNGMTYLHFAVQLADVNTTCLLIRHADIDESIEDDWSLTAKQRAGSRLSYWKKEDNQQMVENMQTIIGILGEPNDPHC